MVEKWVSVVRTYDGNFEHMPWSKIHYGMTELADGYTVEYRWKLLQFTTSATLWMDGKGKTYAAAWPHRRPSDCPSDKFKLLIRIPAYFEELSLEEAEKMVQSVFDKKCKEKEKLQGKNYSYHPDDKLPHHPPCLF